MKDWADFRIDLGGRTGVEVQALCPQCSHTRKKSKALCLSANTEKGVWVCHHCDWAGTLKSGEEARPNRQRLIRRPTFQLPSNIPAPLREAFAARGIPEAVVQRNRIALGDAYLPQCKAYVPCIQFPVYKDGEVVNIKYRAVAEKAFRQEPHAEKVLYGHDDLTEDWGVITEGEFDKLSLEVAGIPNAVSVPDGAPPAGSKPTEAKFEYLRTCEERLNRLTKIILALDNDAPGKVLEEELARRLGPERCWRVTWPDGCKDANDVLRLHGAAVLAACIREALPYPIHGVFEVGMLTDDVLSLYARGLPGGLTTGWNTVDRHYTVKPGEMTILTGIPSHGKSEWLDALMINLAVMHGWRFGVFSPENYPLQRHIAKLMEKYSGKPFRVGPSDRMTELDVRACLYWLDEHFIFLSPAEDELTVDALLLKGKALVRRYGILGLVLDPWNEVDQQRAAATSETDYVSQSLSKIRRFARTYGVHCWIVAHPQKLYRLKDNTYPVPTPYDISGSAHWRNKADNCLTVWRDLEDEGKGVDLYVQKVRFREVGLVGKVTLHFNPKNGRYADSPGGGSRDSWASGVQSGMGKEIHDVDT